MAEEEKKEERKIEVKVEILGKHEYVVFPKLKQPKYYVDITYSADPIGVDVITLEKKDATDERIMSEILQRVAMALGVKPEEVKITLI